MTKLHLIYIALSLGISIAEIMKAQIEYQNKLIEKQQFELLLLNRNIFRKDSVDVDRKTSV